MLQRLFLKITEKISKLSAKIYMPYSRKKITGKDYFAYSNLCSPGDIILTKTEGELSNIGIPGFWSHAAILYDKHSVIEATTHGVKQTNLIDFFMTKDYIVVLKPRFASPNQMSQAAQLAKIQERKPYDYTFNTSDIQSFYCSELVWWCYWMVVNNAPFGPRKIMGRDTIIPSDFWYSSKFDVKWESESWPIR